MKKLYWVLISLFGIALCICSYTVTSTIKTKLVDYEHKQPEKVIENYISEIKRAIEDGTLESTIEFPTIEQASYDKDIKEISDYYDMFAHSENLSYKIKTGSFDETEQSYNITLDNKPVAVVKLESSNEQTELAILKVSDWSIKEVTPILTLEQYNYVIEVPEGCTVKVNDNVITNWEDLDDGNKKYVLDTLYSEPEIVLLDTYDCEMYYNVVDNVVTPILNKYEFKVPISYSVFVNGVEAPFRRTKSEKKYNIETASESLIIKDIYGNEMVYDGTEDIKVYSYDIFLPDTYSLFVNNLNVSGNWIRQKDNSIYKYCEEYATMPKMNYYELKEFIVNPSIVILDNLDEEMPFLVDNGKIEIITQSGTEEMPEVFKQDGFDPLQLGKMWSLYMTDDLEGDTNGFSTIKKYLIKDSYMYKVAYQWATGIDITLTSAHRASDNYFTDEYVGGFIKYSDNLYSFNICFVKHMFLYKSNRWVEDEMNSTFYVMKTEDGNWVIIDIQEIIAVG